MAHFVVGDFSEMGWSNWLVYLTFNKHTIIIYYQMPYIFVRNVETLLSHCINNKVVRLIKKMDFD